MQVDKEELNPCTVRLTVKCGPEQVRAGYDKAYKRASKFVRVPGFRPGTAPAAMVKKFANLEEINRMAVENIVRNAYEQAVKQTGLTPNGNPMVDIVKADEETGEFEFKAKVPLEPQVELSDYIGLTAVQPDPQVTDEEVEQQLTALRERKATRKSITNRGSEAGDFAVVGIKPDGSEGEGRNFMTVIGQTFPQLDQALTGMKVEDAKIVDLTFPEGFQEKDWAGKPMKCQVTLRSLSAPELPDLTEEFAKQFNTETVDQLKEAIRTGLTRAKAQWVKEYVNEQLLEQVINNSTINVADNLWETISAQRLQEMAEEAGKEGRTLADVASEANMTLEQLTDRMNHEALIQVKRAVAIREMFKKEGMKLEQADIRAQLEEVAREHDVTPQQAYQALRQSGNLGEVEFRAMFEKVMALLTEKANLTSASDESK
jgi:trigger factor